MGKKAERPEDIGLVPEQFPELNRQFYAGNLGPHDYLMHRLRSLFLAAQPPERLRDGFDTRLAVGIAGASWPTPEQWDELEIRDYVSAESTVLLHHAAEALFRLYLAHAESPVCPWLEVARLRYPSHFKEGVQTFLLGADTARTARMLMNVFVGAPVAGADREKWSAIKDGLVMLMKYLGRRLLDEGPLYNSAKHGLAVLPGAAAMSFGDQDTAFPIRADGPSITYLTLTEQAEGKRWSQDTVWIDASLNLAMTDVAIGHLRNLWLVASHRYGGQPSESEQMRFVTVDQIAAALHPPSETGIRVTVPSMSWPLLYFTTEPVGESIHITDV